MSAPRAMRCARSRWRSRPTASSTDCSPASRRRTCPPPPDATGVDSARRVAAAGETGVVDLDGGARPPRTAPLALGRRARRRGRGGRRCGGAHHAEPEPGQAGRRRRSSNAARRAVVGFAGLRQLAGFGRQGHRVPPMSRAAARIGLAPLALLASLDRRRPALPAPARRRRRQRRGAPAQGAARRPRPTTSSASCRSSGGRRTGSHVSDVPVSSDQGLVEVGLGSHMVVGQGLDRWAGADGACTLWHDAGPDQLPEPEREVGSVDRRRPAHRRPADHGHRRAATSDGASGPGSSSTAPPASCSGARCSTPGGGPCTRSRSSHCRTSTAPARGHVTDDAPRRQAAHERPPRQGPRRVRRARLGRRAASTSSPATGKAAASCSSSTATACSTSRSSSSPGELDWGALPSGGTDKTVSDEPHALVRDGGRHRDVLERRRRRSTPASRTRRPTRWRGSSRRSPNAVATTGRTRSTTRSTSCSARSAGAEADRRLRRCPGADLQVTFR